MSSNISHYFKINRILFAGLKVGFVLISIIALSFLLLFSILYTAPSVQEKFTRNQFFNDSAAINNHDSKYLIKLNALNKEVQKLAKKVNSLAPVQPYIVINTTINRFYLYRNRKLIRIGYCSSGSYTKLVADSVKNWTFKTPKGKFRIQGKTTSPVWKKPDWAFVEEGLPIPPKNDGSRFEYGVLGDYALSLGDGYLIHGTLYKRFLGMPVTHGCIRLNDNDLKSVFCTLEIGSKVYIY